MKKSVSKGNKSKVKIIIALVTSVVAVSAIGIGLGVGLSGGDGDKKSQESPTTILTLSDLKTTLENLSTEPIMHDKSIIFTDAWENIDDDFFVKVIKKPIIKISSELEAQYLITNFLNFDGDLTINFRIRKKGDENWTSVNPYTVSITGITLGRLIDDLENFTQRILDRNSENGLLEVEEKDLADVMNRYFSPISAIYPFYVTSIKVLPLEGEPINKDGTATIKFEVTTDESEKFIIPLDFKVGQDTWTAKEMLENMSTNPIYKVNGITSSNWKDLDDDFFNTLIEKNKPNLPDNTEVQYRIRDAISNSENLEAGNLVVDFRYRRKDITNDLWTTISSQYKLDIFFDRDLFDAQTTLKNLSKDDISITSDIEAETSWQQITDEVYRNIMKVEPPSFSSNIEVEYKIPNPITQDGELVVNLRYKKVGSSNWYTINHRVRALGLNIQKAKTYINSLQKKAYSDYINTLDNLLSTFDNSILLTKDNANLIFNFPEGEEYQQPLENLYIYVTIEESTITSTQKKIKFRFHFSYETQSDDIFYEITVNLS